MKKLLVFIFLMVSVFCHAQNKKQEKKLYYFLTKDSLLGVKDEHDKVIIKPMPTYTYWGQKELRTPLEGNIIYLDYTEERGKVPVWGSVYNRKGEFLYTPAEFDNGSDPFVEGYERFVKNDKMGFVNRNGDIVIPAMHDYIAWFLYGTARYCDGCTWTSKDEHQFVTGGTWGYMNYKGQPVTVLTNSNSNKDQVIDSAHFLPYQFYYSAFEKKIVDSFSKLENIADLHFVNYGYKLDSNEKKIYYEIVERPSSFYPYYHIVGYTYSKSDGYSADFVDLNFYVTNNGKEYFAYDMNGKKVTLQQWIKLQKKEAQEYLKKYPNAPNRF